MKPFKFLQRRPTKVKRYDLFVLKDMCNRNIYMQVAWAQFPRTQEEEETHNRKQFNGNILQFYTMLKFRPEGMITPTIYEMSVVRRGYISQFYVFGNMERRTNKFLSRACKVCIIYTEN